MRIFGLLGPIGVPELLLIAMILVLLFGSSLLPKLFRGVGESVSELKKSVRANQPAAQRIRNESDNAPRTLFGRAPRD